MKTSHIVVNRIELCVRFLCIEDGKTISSYEGSMLFSPRVERGIGVMAMEACVHACYDEAVNKFEEAESELRRKEDPIKIEIPT